VFIIALRRAITTENQYKKRLFRRIGKLYLRVISPRFQLVKRFAMRLLAHIEHV
jgi:hypothetical protein